MLIAFSCCVCREQIRFLIKKEFIVDEFFTTDQYYIEKYQTEMLENGWGMLLSRFYCPSHITILEERLKEHQKKNNKSCSKKAA